MQWLKELVLRPEKKLGAKGSQPNSHATSFFVTFVEEMLSFNVNLQGIFHLKSFIAPITRRVFPLAAAMQAVFVGWSCAPGKKIARWQENTTPKFNPDQCKKVSPCQARNSSKQAKKKTIKRQAGN